MKNYFQQRPRGRVSRTSHASGYDHFTNQITLQQTSINTESTANIVSDEYEITLKWKRAKVRPIKPSNEVGLKRVRLQGKCSLIFRSSKFLEIQTTAKIENVKSTKILFLFTFYYHFQFVLIQITKFRQVPHVFKLPSNMLKVEVFSCFPIYIHD